MSKSRLVLLALCALAIMAIFTILLSVRQKIMDCESVPDQTARDDCYHDLAHATNDRSLCNKITDAAEKEHCLGHVAG